MEHTEFEEFRIKKLHSLKVWKTIIIIHGINLFFLVYLAIIGMITSGYGFLGFFKELFDELVHYPEMIISYVIISAYLNIFTIPRLIALYRIIEAVILGERKVKHVLFYVLGVVLQFVTLLFGLNYFLSRAHKPVIYLYPEKETSVNVRLALNGELTTSYPVYDSNGGWTVTAYPDGTLVDRSGRKYPFLFWEGEVTIKPDLSHGFCVKGEDTAAFLEKSLKQLGLTETEADAFIMYWLPQMQGNRYNVISFQTSAYENAVSHKIDPEPDTVIVVNMLWYPSNSSVSIKPQTLTGINPSERKGFTVVEWGGEKYRKGIFKVHIT